MSILKVGHFSVQISNSDKILFPEHKITKGNLIEYYQKIAPIMVPLMKDRAVSMHRFPDGIHQEGFYQKDIANYYPDWIKSVRISKEGGYNKMVVCNNAATLVYLANQACITPHLWLSRIDKLHYPDRMIFDLDPGKEGDFALVCKTALLLRQALQDYGLIPFVMTTGSKGLHVVVPLKRKEKFDNVRLFAHKVAELFAQKDPQNLTIEPRKDKRKGRLYIDVARNAYAQTGVAPYAVRALPGAPVATPLEWDELEDKRLTAQTYTIKNIFKRIDKVGDVWKDINKSARAI